MDKSCSTPGINEETLLEQAKKYKLFREEQVKAGLLESVSEGILIWDEVKVMSDIIQI